MLVYGPAKRQRQDQQVGRRRFLNVRACNARFWFLDKMAAGSSPNEEAQVGAWGGLRLPSITRLAPNRTGSSVQFPGSVQVQVPDCEITTTITRSVLTSTTTLLFLERL